MSTHAQIHTTVHACTYIHTQTHTHSSIKISSHPDQKGRKTKEVEDKEAGRKKKRSRKEEVKEERESGRKHRITTTSLAPNFLSF